MQHANHHATGVMHERHNLPASQLVTRTGQPHTLIKACLQEASSTLCSAAVASILAPQHLALAPQLTIFKLKLLCLTSLLIKLNLQLLYLPHILSLLLLLSMLLLLRVAWFAALHVAAAALLVLGHI